jgi:23S rRNA pseudouridine1911/1915/1917 synthase
LARDFQVDKADAGQRLDHYLQTQMREFSRSRLQDWIKAGRVRVNGQAAKPSVVLRGGERIDVEPAALPKLNAKAEEIPLNILYSDDAVVVVNKPAGMAVHSGAGLHSGTLVNALLHHFGQLSTVGGDERPGIVHRLDKDTSGVLVVARTDAAHRQLAEQFASRQVTKIYLALVHGSVSQETGQIRTPITRDPVRRTRMTAKLGEGRSAFTEYRVLQRFERFTLLEVRIGTGRTHQIRVHLSSIRHAVAGDRLYGAPEAHKGRFFLHAHRLAFVSPATGQPVTVEAPLPPELKAWLAEL